MQKTLNWIVNGYYENYTTSKKLHAKFENKQSANSIEYKNA
jgi:hypothetical protein